MAIIQISKIQQRSGNLVDLPQLSEAQLGWANDAKRLFIGGTGNANTYNENIEVLTSYSDITFSQINGSEGNLNISNAQTGQILTYVVVQILGITQVVTHYNPATLHYIPVVIFI